MLVREKEKKRRDSAEMESMVMDTELVEEGRKSGCSKLPLGNNEWISLSKVHMTRQMTTLRGISAKYRMEKTSWFGHVEFEKPTEFSGRVHQICRSLGACFWNCQRDMLEKIKSKVDSQQERSREEVDCKVDRVGLGGILWGVWGIWREERETSKEN